MYLKGFEQYISEKKQEEQAFNDFKKNKDSAILEMSSVTKQTVNELNEISEKELFKLYRSFFPVSEAAKQTITAIYKKAFGDKFQQSKVDKMVSDLKKKYPKLDDEGIIGIAQNALAEEVDLDNVDAMYNSWEESKKKKTNESKENESINEDAFAAIFKKYQGTIGGNFTKDALSLVRQFIDYTLKTKDNEAQQIALADEIGAKIARTMKALSGLKV